MAGTAKDTKLPEYRSGGREIETPVPMQANSSSRNHTKLRLARQFRKETTHSIIETLTMDTPIADKAQIIVVLATK